MAATCPGALAKALAWGVGVALLVSIGLNVWLPYHMSALNMDSWMEQGNARWTVSSYAADMGSVKGGGAGANWQMTTFFGAGVCVTAFLLIMRAAFH